MHESNSIDNAQHAHDTYDTQGPVDADGQQESHSVHDTPVAIDCDSCDVRGLACGDCVITVLLGAPPSFLDDEEQRALDVLAESGLVPPLRLVTSQEPATRRSGDTSQGRISTSARRDAYRARDTG